jgi:hypothetical protein
VNHKGFAPVILLAAAGLIILLLAAFFYLSRSFTHQPISQSSQTKNQQTASPSQTNNSVQMPKSSYFSQDHVAIELVEKNQSRDIKAFTDNINLIKDQNNSPTLFEYKITSALRMLGMTKPTKISSAYYIGELLLNQYQRLHNLEQSPDITADTLNLIDSELFIKEQRDEILAKQFPLYDRFTESVPNQPTKNFVVSLYTLSLQSLPPHLIHWDKLWLEVYLKAQYPAVLVDSTNPSWKICTGAYGIYGISNPCSQTSTLYPGKTPSLQTNDHLILMWDELNLIDTILHEYGHFIDKNVYPNNDIAIDTTAFYNISFNASSPRSHVSPNDIDKYYRRDASKNRNEFVSGYAAGNFWTEDFAESFTMYVLQGNPFRELAKQDEFMNEKYEWLKQTVFKGVEYNTGTYIGGVVPSEMQHPQDYWLLIPDFHLTFDFPKK